MKSLVLFVFLILSVSVSVMPQDSSNLYLPYGFHLPNMEGGQYLVSCSFSSETNEESVNLERSNLDVSVLSTYLLIAPYDKLAVKVNLDINADDNRTSVIPGISVSYKPSNNIEIFTKYSNESYQYDTNNQFSEKIKMSNTHTVLHIGFNISGKIKKSPKDTGWR